MDATCMQPLASVWGCERWKSYIFFDYYKIYVDLGNKCHLELGSHTKQLKKNLEIEKSCKNLMLARKS